MPNPGKYVTKGIIRRPGERTRLPGGGYTDGEPVTVASNVWVLIKGLKTLEAITAMQTQAKPSVRIEMGYRTGLDETMEFVSGGRTWKFSGPPMDETGRREEIVVLARQQ